ncbi:hypothetical protein BKA66DRAFT_50903 [Pyrenochaeta sp. MPI-SDFR-AT-0127]|nr:hypothetical protein BKA66DRAFT_50903 [Pyrenochaeta sp. MPI-SDFR-AT-0127]
MHARRRDCQPWMRLSRLQMSKGRPTCLQRAGYIHVGELQNHRHDHLASLSHAQQRCHPCTYPQATVSAAVVMLHLLPTALHQRLQTLSRRCGFRRIHGADWLLCTPSRGRIRNIVLVYQIASHMLGLNASNNASIRGFHTAMHSRLCAEPTQTLLSAQFACCARLQNAILLFHGPWNAGEHVFASPRNPRCSEADRRRNEREDSKR